MSLYALILVLLVIIAAAYILNTMLSVPEPIKMIFNVVLALALVVLVLSVTGVIGSLETIRVGQ